DAVGSDPPEDGVLRDAFLGGQRVLDGVAASGVEQPVVTARRAVREIPTLDEDGLETPHGGVADNAGARRAAADDQHFGLEGRHYSQWFIGSVTRVHSARRTRRTNGARRAREEARGGLRGGDR